MKVICNSCKAIIDTDKHDFCPKCGASLSLAGKMPEKDDLGSLSDKDKEEKSKKQVMAAFIGFFASIALIIMKALFDM